MDRNLSRRVEVVFPVEQPDLKQRVIDILKLTLADNAKARELLPDGTYQRVKPPEGVPPLRSQQRFLELAAEGVRLTIAPEPPPVPEPRVAKRSKRENARRST
jgi:polyphosphate kinase